MINRNISRQGNSRKDFFSYSFIFFIILAVTTTSLILSQENSIQPEITGAVSLKTSWSCPIEYSYFGCTEWSECVPFEADPTKGRQTRDCPCKCYISPPNDSNVGSTDCDLSGMYNSWYPFDEPKFGLETWDDQKSVDRTCSVSENSSKAPSITIVYPKDGDIIILKDKFEYFNLEINTSVAMQCQYGVWVIGNGGNGYFKYAKQDLTHVKEHKMLLTPKDYVNTEELKKGAYKIRYSCKNLEGDEIFENHNFEVSFESESSNGDSCNENWKCTGWSDCEDSVKIRTCTDLNNCNTSKDIPRESIECVLDEDPKLCIENWDCGDWSLCNSGIRIRDCIDLNTCRTTQSKPVDTINCESSAPGNSPLVGIIIGLILFSLVSFLIWLIIRYIKKKKSASQPASNYQSYMNKTILGAYATE